MHNCPLLWTSYGGLATLPLLQTVSRLLFWKFKNYTPFDYATINSFSFSILCKVFGDMKEYIWGALIDFLPQVHYPVPESLASLAWGQAGRLLSAIFLGMFRCLSTLSLTEIIMICCQLGVGYLWQVDHFFLPAWRRLGLWRGWAGWTTSWSSSSLCLSSYLWWLRSSYNIKSRTILTIVKESSFTGDIQQNGAW